MNPELKLTPRQLVWPRRGFRVLAQTGSSKLAVIAAASTTAVYSAFVLILYLGGHQPSFTGNPIPPESYYLWQAIFLWLWLPMAFAVNVLVAQGMLHLFGDPRPLKTTASTLPITLAMPLLVAYLTPEIIAYAVAGHDALIAVMRIAAPITLLWWMALTALCLRVVHGCTRPAALVTTLASTMATIVFVAILVR